MRTILLWPDTHIPYQHRRAVSALLDYVATETPHEVLFLGDLYDCKPVARWSKDTVAERGELMQAEADAGKRFLHEFRQAYDGPARIVLGNHEDRWTNYLERYAPGLYGLRDLTIDRIFHFSEFDILIDKQPYQITPDLVAIHGNKLSQHAGQSAFKELQRHGQSIVQGHSHRLGLVYYTQEKRRFAMECGWLGDVRHADYLPYQGVSNWQLGFGLLHVDGRKVYPQLIPVDPGGSFVIGGRRYG